jgi:hypothetical protein
MLLYAPFCFSFPPSFDVGFLPKVVAVRVASDRRAWTASPFLPCTRARARDSRETGGKDGRAVKCCRESAPELETRRSSRSTRIAGRGRHLTEIAGVSICAHAVAAVSFPLRRGVHSGQPRTMPSCAASGNGSRSEPLCRAGCG